MVLVLHFGTIRFYHFDRDPHGTPPVVLGLDQRTFP